MAINQLNHRGGTPCRTDKKTGKVRKGWAWSKTVPSLDSIALGFIESIVSSVKHFADILYLALKLRL
jgi:hypothetical protein